jgi:serine/threonine protein kinase/WD40 repeat protein
MHAPTPTHSERLPGSSAVDLAALHEQAEPALRRLFDPPQAPGELGRLGIYRILRRLGVGGMGMVFEAEDVQLRRPVALKIMLPDVAQKPQNVARFLREAQATAALVSDHIVRIYQVGADHVIPYLAMEYLRGETLDDWLLRNKPLTLTQAVRIIRETAKGLAVAHAAGLIHRDIKPGNLWLEKPHGRVKILDFGLARMTKCDEKLTQSGFIVGTPQFMAPEQARNSPQLDQRCDLFSLGVVLYRLLAGRLPFDCGDPLATLAAVVHDEPVPVQLRNPAVPLVLADLTQRLLQKDPAQRVGSAEELTRQLLVVERALAQQPPQQIPAAQPPGHAQITEPESADLPPPATSRRWWWGVGFAVGLVGLVVGGYWLTRPAPVPVVPAPPEPVFAPVAGGHTFFADVVDTGAADWLAAGELVASLHVDGRLTLRDRHTTNERHLFRPVQAQALATLPASGWLATGAPTGVISVWRWPHNERQAPEVSRQFRHGIRPIERLAFTPTGELLASASADGTVQLHDLQRTVSLTLPGVYSAGVSGLAFAEDGRTLYITQRDSGAISRYDVAGKAEWPALASGLNELTALTLLADPPRLAVGDLSGQLVVIDPATNAMQTWANGAPITALANTPCGRLLVGSADGQVRSWEVLTQKCQHAFAAHASPVVRLALAPTGAHLLTAGHEGVRVWDAEPVSAWPTPVEAKPTRWLTGHTGRVRWTAFTPTGKPATASADGTARIWSADGSQVEQTLRGHTGGVEGLAFHGTLAATTSFDRSVRVWDITTGELKRTFTGIPGTTTGVTFRPGHSQVWAAGGAGGTDFAVRWWNLTDNQTGVYYRVHTAHVTAVEISPNGNLVVSAGLDMVPVVASFQTNRVVQLPGHTGWVEHANFAPDSTLLATASRDGQCILWDLNGLRRRRALVAEQGFMGVAFSPDGKTLATAGVDGRVRWWSVATGQPLAVGVGHTGEVCHVAFSPDGQWLLSGDSGGRAALWDIRLIASP